MRHAYIISLCLGGTLLLSGCSGHALQDWADETFNEKAPASSPEVAKPTKTEPLKVQIEQAETKPNASVAPSQNRELDRVSPMPVAKSEGGAMQQSLDEWTKEEWTPITEQDERIKAMNQDKDRPFTIQEYVDKAMIYQANKPKSDQPSHVEQMKELPVIGK